MSDLEKLKSCKSLNDLAVVLKYKPSALAYILYKLPDSQKYEEFTIPKKSGGSRKIRAPKERLMALQKRLSEVLNNCYSEVIKNYGNPLSHGFRKDCSIVTNALLHRNRRFVFNIDLKDFFPSINFGRVRGFFIYNKHFSLEPKVATVIAQIVCYDNELPQGSPCSPVVSNLVGHLLDIKLVQLAKLHKCSYSRYADDITFSTNKKDFPEEIAYIAAGGDWEPGPKLTATINKMGFAVNERKVSMQSKTRRQVVTGLVVNKKVNVKKEYYRIARAMCHSLFNNGSFYISTMGNDTTQSGTIDSNNNCTAKQLEGILSYIYMIKGVHDSRTNVEKRNKPASIMKAYRQFLFYKHFYQAEKPVLICEGKTDHIYIRCALKQLHQHYPALIEKTTEGWSWKITFLKMSENFREVLSIAEGTSGLAALMDMYKKNIGIFKDGTGKKHPVVMLIDNDKGAKEIKSKLKKTEDGKGYKPYFTENLYVMTLPQGANGEEIEIEDLFDKDLLETKVAGKSFNKKTKTDTKTEYSKIIFAEKVIKPKQHIINFSNFMPVLNHLNGIILSYQHLKGSAPTEKETEALNVLLPTQTPQPPIYVPGV
ncbi:retron Ec67 family RNA-directed DNA polymerase/endonuclease [Geomonas paludis]|uniref:RNA-directed DNA polymerase n=1 Tax=Geomonas paludis TaxID=2740185 RepID=A0A6V8MSU2_9BACT|nr:retron Ec67 family RNA-directed DNA polymerase/endonuclease [Geomonas paludis]GFO63160.1 hypothetical protein GMPD_10790 [Geomonas paludis]